MYTPSDQNILTPIFIQLHYKNYPIIYGVFSKNAEFICHIFDRNSIVTIFLNGDDTLTDYHYDTIEHYLETFVFHNYDFVVENARNYQPDQYFDLLSFFDIQDTSENKEA